MTGGGGATTGGVTGTGGGTTTGGVTGTGGGAVWVPVPVSVTSNGACGPCGVTVSVADFAPVDVGIEADAHVARVADRKRRGRGAVVGAGCDELKVARIAAAQRDRCERVRIVAGVRDRDRLRARGGIDVDVTKRKRAGR